MLIYDDVAYDNVCNKILAVFNAIDELETVTFIDGEIAQKDYKFPYIEFDIGDIKTNEGARNANQIATVTFEAIICAKSGPDKNRDITKLGLKILTALRDSRNKLSAYHINLLPNFFKKSGSSAAHQGEASRQLYFTIDIKIAESELVNA